MDLNTNPVVASALVAPALALAQTGIAEDDDDVDDVEPRLFFETDAARRVLLCGAKTASRIADALGIPRAQTNDYGTPHQVQRSLLSTNLERLVGCGLVSVKRARRCEGGGVYRLTLAGHESLGWAAPPKPVDAHERAWAADLVRAIADFYDIDVGDVLRGPRPGPAMIARARFAYALWARGWSTERIAGSFGMQPRWAERGVNRWKAIRHREAKPSPKAPDRKRRG
jgi:hypothetical protein